MHYDFDEVIPRIGTNSAKWEFFPVAGIRSASTAADPARGEDQVLPMWVADMDFRCAQPIIDALVARAQHGIFGYTVTGDNYYETVIDWYHRRHGWRAERAWIVAVSGVVPAINMLVRAFTQPGEKVIIQTPVYHPFYKLDENNKIELVHNPLIEEDRTYRMDFDQLEKVVADPKAKVLILCNPHNPGGICWQAGDLRRLVEICSRNDVVVVSDEIHGDLILPGKSFTSIGALGPEIFEKVVICTAPTKTFSLAGLHLSSIIVPNPELREKFSQAIAGTGLTSINPFALTALETAYREGEDWLDQVMQYVADNYAYLKNFLARNLPQIKPFEPDATYLIWLDCRGLGMDHRSLEIFMQERVKLTLNEGYTFGDAGRGFERINLACPRSMLVMALQRLKQEVDQLEIQ